MDLLVEFIKGRDRKRLSVKDANERVISEVTTMFLNTVYNDTEVVSEETEGWKEVVTNDGRKKMTWEPGEDTNKNTPSDSEDDVSITKELDITEVVSSEDPEEEEEEEEEEEVEVEVEVDVEQKTRPRTLPLLRPSGNEVVNQEDFIRDENKKDKEIPEHWVTGIIVDDEGNKTYKCRCKCRCGKEHNQYIDLDETFVSCYDCDRVIEVYTATENVGVDGVPERDNYGNFFFASNI